jgi:hypothetical protein
MTDTKPGHPPTPQNQEGPTESPPQLPEGWYVLLYLVFAHCTHCTCCVEAMRLCGHRVMGRAIGAGVRLSRWARAWRGRSASAAVSSVDAATSSIPNLQSRVVTNAFGNILGLHSGTESLANTTLCSSAQAFRSGTCRNTLRLQCPPPRLHRSSTRTPIRNHRQK